MSTENPGPILDWARNVLAENAGGDLEFVYHLEPGYNLETIRALTDFLRDQEDFQSPHS
jgi:hypothetical protein